MAKFFNITKLSDTHCHLNDEAYDNDRHEVIQRALDSGVTTIYDMPVKLEDCKKSLEISSKYNSVRSFLGIHPDIFLPGNDNFVGLDKTKDWIDKNISELEDLVKKNLSLVHGIGEIGIDYYRTKDLSLSEREKSHELQQYLFERQLQLAVDNDFPVCVHSRNSELNCFETVSKFNVTGVFHSYTGNLEIARNLVQKDWAISFNGILTYKNAQGTRDLFISLISKDNITTEEITPEWFYNQNIFFETDGPFLTPLGIKVKRNEPANVLRVYEKAIEIVRDFKKLVGQ